MQAGQVGKIRELTRGIEAEVCVGATGKYGYTILKVVGVSPQVQNAMKILRNALRKEAHDQLVAAQMDTIIRTGDAIGVPDDE
jgi:hypothetical protein